MNKWHFVGHGDVIMTPEEQKMNHMIGGALRQGKIAELAKRVEQKGFMTGSRAWGVHKPDSDYDHVIMDYDVRDLIDVKLFAQYGDETETVSIKVSDGERVVNLIVCMKHYNYKNWEQAGFTMESMMREDSCMRTYCMRRETRVRIFQAIRDHLGNN